MKPTKEEFDIQQSLLDTERAKNRDSIELLMRLVKKYGVMELSAFEIVDPIDGKLVFEEMIEDKSLVYHFVPNSLT